MRIDATTVLSVVMLWLALFCVFFFNTPTIYGRHAVIVVVAPRVLCSCYVVWCVTVGITVGIAVGTVHSVYLLFVVIFIYLCIYILCMHPCACLLNNFSLRMFL